MTVTCAPVTSGYEVALPRRAVLPPVASLSAAETAARGDVVAAVAAAARVTATIAAPLGSNRTTCPTAGRSRAVVVASWSYAVIPARYGSLASPLRTSIIGPTPVGSPGLVSAGSDAALWWTGKFLAAVALPPLHLELL